MIRATAIVRRAAVKAERVTDIVTLDHQARHRRRIVMTGEKGTQFLLDLEKATVLDHGDALKLEDGRLVRVEAAPERLVEVKTTSPLRLLKAAWHLGNRHVPAEITEEAIYFAEDHVLLEMVRGLGASATSVERPFRPEKGAYEAAEAHGAHGHHDHHGHAHGHGHAHAHGHDHDSDAHVHGPGCGHAHGQAQSGHGHHGHAHSEAESHAHAHAEAHPQGHDHDHGEGCGCDPRPHPHG
ncbi:urease accessory protein UreE [Aquabacter spiritensis]|uniref:Urease accessory protein UreE n=1 Tax=Aquabacter spiritensis TaxID=933073 RepID=A0A4R3M2W6_9HYPH|nr:urease accessory protein UreE [Aquabacter spiritensis]TCT07554.1 urease accessory protein [Aquabacter spiritensis]